MDSTDLGRNPARILPVVQDYLAVRGKGPARAVVGPVRRTDEIVDCRLHEASCAGERDPSYVRNVFAAAELDRKIK